MRVGLDVYSIHHLKLDPFQTLHFAVEHKLDGVQFHWPGEISPTLDSGKLAEIRQEANRLGLYLEVGLPTINPYHFDSERAAQVKALGDGDYVRGIVKAIEAAQGIGCHELRTNIGAREDRLDPTWPAQVRAATEVIQQLRSVLLNGGSRINVENHADATTFELVRLVENAGPDIAGICLDVGNVCRQLEDPVRAAQRAAPYVHLTHTKDAILFFTECGLAWQARPCGRGVISWDVILPILGKYAPDLTLSIEDEPPVRELPIFNPTFLAWHPDLTTIELAELVRLARLCQVRVDRGEIPEPHQYEATGWEAEGAARLDVSDAHLKAVLAKVGLLGLSSDA